MSRDGSRANPASVARLQYLARFSPPEISESQMSRPRIMKLLDDSVARQPVTILAAPSGYGKTSAASEWAHQQNGPVAWLSLTRFDSEDDVVSRGITDALKAISQGAPNLTKAADWDELEAPAQFTRDIERLLSEIAEKVILIIDDADLAAESLKSGRLASLISHCPTGLRLVLVGKPSLESELSRYVMSQPRSLIRGTDLAFTLEEIGEHFADQPKLNPNNVLELTQGWPIAVHMVAFTGLDAPSSDSIGLPIREYIRDHVLNSFNAELRDFAMQTAMGLDLTEGLAAAITGNPQSLQILESCAKQGLFIERVRVEGGAIFRWNKVVSTNVQEILRSSDPQLYLLCRQRAATYLESSDPLTSISLWLECAEPGRAFSVLLSQWLWLIVGVDARALDQVCVSLPAPYDDDPVTMVVRACAQDVIGARELARHLLERAEKKSTTLSNRNTYEQVEQIARILVAEDEQSLADAVERSFRVLSDFDELPARQRLAALYLIGWAELRLRKDFERGLSVLNSAVAEAQALGETEVARRALTHLATMLTWGGKMRKASEIISELKQSDPDTGSGIDEQYWKQYDGGGLALSEAFIAYWDNRLSDARVALDHVLSSSNSLNSFAGLARVLLAFTAAAQKDSAGLRLAAREIQVVPREDSRGIQWSNYRGSALAVLYAADGQMERSNALIRNIAQKPGTRMITVFVAELVRRQGDPQEAMKMLMAIKQFRSVSYVSVALLSTMALIRRQSGEGDEAHRLIEQALDEAAEDSVKRPFADAELDMRQLLADHLSWGTKHEQFIVECLAPTEESGPMDALSEREQAVFSFLRTTRTVQEIADALGVSVNTVKTHQRSIYRKLQVSSRREAIRKFG